MSGNKFDGFALVDRARSACLCDVGAPRHSAAVAVTSDGHDTLWIVDEVELHAEHPRHGDANQPHEQLGRLPAVWRRSIVGDPRCGAPTAAGRPCRMKVANQGDTCAIHSCPRCRSCGQMMYFQAGAWGCFGCHPDRRWTPQQQDRGVP